MPDRHHAAARVGIAKSASNSWRRVECLCCRENNGSGQMTAIRCALIIGASVGLAGCYQSNPPLFFAQAHTLGVGVHTSTTQQSADLTLGYKDFDVAIVPVSATDGSGRVVPLTGTAGGEDSRD